MGDIKLFSLQDNVVTELNGISMTIEKPLQMMIEENLEDFLGIKFLGSEYPTGKKHGGRIDTLGIDENNSPVILEFKRAVNENVINQGLFYLEWLLDHKAEFQMLVMEKYGKSLSDEIEWDNPRLVCIAGGFTKYDEHAVQLIDRNIELYRYKYYEENFLLLDLVNATSAQKNQTPSFNYSVHKTRNTNKQSSFEDNLNQIDVNLRNTYESMYDYVMALDDEIQFKKLKYYGAFKRIKNFLCVEVLTKKQILVVYIKADSSNLIFEEGFSRDVTHIGHYGTGNIELTLRNKDDLEKAKPLINISFENN